MTKGVQIEDQKYLQNDRQIGNLPQDNYWPLRLLEWIGISEPASEQKKSQTNTSYHRCTVVVNRLLV